MRLDCVDWGTGLRGLGLDYVDWEIGLRVDWDLKRDRWLSGRYFSTVNAVQCGTPVIPRLTSVCLTRLPTSPTPHNLHRIIVTVWMRAKVSMFEFVL